MKKNVLLIITSFILSIVLLAGCSGAGTQESTAASGESEITAADTQTAEAASVEETTAAEEPIDKEILKLCTFSLKDFDFTLPVSFQEFSEKTGYSYENTLTEGYSEDTIMPPYTTIGLVFQIDNGNIVILTANQTDKELAAKDSEVIGIKLSRIIQEDMDVPFAYQGLSWDSSFEDIIKAFGKSDTDEENREYHLMGYTKKRDSSSNVSYSFVADQEYLYSFALSVDNMRITYAPVDLETETTAN